MIRSRDAVEVVDQVALGGVGAVEERLVEVRERHAVARLGLLLRAHAPQTVPTAESKRLDPLVKSRR